MVRSNTNTRTSQFKGPVKAFYDFIQGIPRPLATDIDGKSKSSRPPSLYDKHLDPGLVLKQVHRHSNILTFINESLHELFGKLTEFPQDAQRMHEMDKWVQKKEVIQNKKTVLNSELKVQASFSEVIGYPVATFAEYFLFASLQPNVGQEFGILFDTDRGIYKAIADSVWYLHPISITSLPGDDKDDEMHVVEDEMQVEEERKKELAESAVAAADWYRPLVVVEFKAVAVAFPEIFDGITQFAKRGAQFEWAHCSGCTEPSHTPPLWPISPSIIDVRSEI